jgi:hypothetical protein
MIIRGISYVDVMPFITDFFWRIAMNTKMIIKQLAFALMICAGAQTHAEPISPYLFGQNHWLADGNEGRVGHLKDLWPKVKASGVKIVRIGGNGYEREFPDRTELNSMIDNIQGIGAEPLLQVPRFFTALQAKELVEYYTKNNKRQIRFWSIGNEPMLHDQNTIEEVHEYLVRLGTAMREVSKDIKIFVFDEASLIESAYSRIIGGDLDITGLKVNGAWLVDGVTFHSYPNGKEFIRSDVVFTGPKKILDQILVLKKLMTLADDKYGRVGDSKLKWGITEFNVTYRNPNREISGIGNPSFLGGQFMAEIFGYAMEYGAFMANPWCINEVDDVATDFGYLGFPREFYPRSSYYHMQMMAQAMKGDFVPSENNHPSVKTIASRNEGGISILVMNQHVSSSFGFDLSLNGREMENSKELKIILKAGLDSNIEGNISPQTSLLIEINSKGNVIKSTKYALTDNLENLAPSQSKLTN